MEINIIITGHYLKICWKKTCENNAQQFCTQKDLIGLNLCYLTTPLLVNFNGARHVFSCFDLNRMIFRSDSWRIELKLNRRDESMRTATLRGWLIINGELIKSPSQANSNWEREKTSVERKQHPSDDVNRQIQNEKPCGSLPHTHTHTHTLTHTHRVESTLKSSQLNVKINRNEPRFIDCGHYLFNCWYQIAT